MYKITVFYLMENIFTDEYFMKRLCRKLKWLLERRNTSAIVVVNNTIIARSHNLTELLNDVTAHAEMQAITAAKLSWGQIFKDCTLYVTLEPCQMCAGALY
jgi:tRNA(adenine34) deaminase